MSEEREKEPNFLVEAFKNQYNLIGLGTALAFTLLSASPFPLILAAGLEMMLLPFMERWERLKRAQALVGAESRPGGRRRPAVSAQDQRRRQILKTLRDQDRQQKKATLSISAKMQQAGLGDNVRNFWIASGVLPLTRLRP